MMIKPFGRLRRAHSANPLRRKVFEDGESWPCEENPEIATTRQASVPSGEYADDRNLRGYFRKRHGTALPRGAAGTMHGDKDARWAQRYVSIDDAKGRLSYCKSSDREWRVAVPLQDVTSVRALPPLPSDAGTRGAHCFEVDAGYLRIVLGADDEAECHRWVGAIERRAEHWRTKAFREGRPTAKPVFGVPEHKCWSYDVPAATRASTAMIPRRRVLPM